MPLTGWWGHDKATRFQMTGEFSAIPTAEGWQLSNPPILSLAAIRASLAIFDKAGGIEPLRQRAIRQHQFFRDCLEASLKGQVKTIAPSECSGCQLSLQVNLEHTSNASSGKEVYERLERAGVRTDWREPNVIRAAPTPLYNTFEEIWRFVDVLESALS